MTPSYEEVVTRLLSEGYKGESRCDRLTRKERYHWFDGTMDGVRICVFSENYPHPALQGCIAGESKNSFNKWTQAYYLTPYPKKENAWDQVLADLQLLDHPTHVERANSFEDFDRDAHKKDQHRRSPRTKRR